MGLTRASNCFVRTVLRLPLRDCNSGYRGFWRHTLERIDVQHAFSPDPAIVHELLFETQRAGLRIRELPIRFQERELGSSTLTFRKLLRSYVNVLRLARMDLRRQLLTTEPTRSDVAPEPVSPRAAGAPPDADVAAGTK